MDDPMAHPLSLSPSPLYELRSTPSSGRGLFAQTDISTDTLVLSTATSSRSHSEESFVNISPLAWLIQRTYRKEACAHCFAYDRGREWKLKVPGRNCGLVFCTEPCRDAWLDRNGPVGVEAWEALERGVQAMLKQNANVVNTAGEEGGRSSEHEAGTDTKDAEITNAIQQQVLSEEVEARWENAALDAKTVVAAITGPNPSKYERKVLQRVREQGGDPDLMYFMLTAVVSVWNIERVWRPPAAEITGRINNGADENLRQMTASLRTDGQNECRPDSGSISESLSVPYSLSPATQVDSSSRLSGCFYDTLSALTPTLSAYLSLHTSLRAYITSYLFLLSLLPSQLIHPELLFPPQLPHALATRAAHNAFSIRPSTTTSSDEFLGYAIYPSASFFNHSCDPNISKVREERNFAFFAARQIKRGEELCISYLGGDEKDPNVGMEERRVRLRREWGFECCCTRCTEETNQLTIG